MAAFHGKIGWGRLRKGENKNYRSIMFLPNRLVKIPKKNNKKIQKIQLWHHFRPKQVGKGCEREKIKIMAPLCSYPTGQRKFQKNDKKIQKTQLRHHFQPKQGGKGFEREKIKIIVLLCSYPTGQRKFKKYNYCII